MQSSTRAGEVLALTPFHTPDVQLVLALHRANEFAILDLGCDRDAAVAALEHLAREAPRYRFGVRVSPALDLTRDELPSGVTHVVLPAGSPLDQWSGLERIVQVTSLAEARQAIAAGAEGLISKGNESGGRIGDESSFILLQQIMKDGVGVPVWVQGGVGIHTAAACVAGGAAGVVLDSQLSLVPESSLPPEIKSAITSMDGSETLVSKGYRVFSRPDLPVQDLLAEDNIDALLGARDLRTNLLPAGQDAAFASDLAAQFKTAAGVVRGVRQSITAGLRSAARLKPLRRRSPFAEEHRLEFPIAQGPMTRVSDTPEFARSVADAGALPFLALAVMRGSESKTLLHASKALLDGKPWGVGILGFVPPELREEQLEAIREVHPPFALIAGGRPAQAATLEAEGIPTYLHVPSLGLLDLFLKQGSRRFVFEGQECGGHIGPRTSFVLWEQQVQRLLQHDNPEELSILFAGGIHDGRSAAMVSALVAPLAARGAKVGVLMGTAYLLTEEAVKSGAILPAYQEAVANCDATALLETAPGHVTRCAETDYVQAFRETRLALEAQGTPPQEMWASLEELNLGRLRIASKGVQREGSKLVTVDEETQRREGMVMLGQVATLRREIVTMKDLHASVSDGAEEVLSLASQARLQAPRPSSAGDIAIVGMASIMPGAPDLETFWTNILDGTNSITEVPQDRWSSDIFFDPQSMNGEKTPSKWGGFLEPLPFDPLQYGIPPLSLAAIEPSQLLALEVSQRALVDAGYGSGGFNRERTSVFFGAEGGTDLAGAYGFRALWKQYAGEIPPELDEVLPTLTEDSFPGILGNVIAGRIANRLDLGGSNYTVDAACASSLAAVDVACKELLARTSDMVICGGVDLHNSIVDYLVFASVHALSPTGQCKTFDAAADGIALGEGVGAVVLKRLEDAEADGDRIYAVIRGVGSSSDGKSLGLTAPRAEGQLRALERAYERAGVSPADIGMVEAHGTGTVVGDRTELETLQTFFMSAGADAASSTLGSVKALIGHTKCAAGLAGLIKAALSLHHQVRPPAAHINEPNPGWKASGPFVFNRECEPWADENRFAGVSAFGFGGTNFHIVLASHPGTPAQANPWSHELFLLRGETREDIAPQVETLLALCDSGQPYRLRDLALSASRGDAPMQAAVVASSLDDLATKLRGLLNNVGDSGVSTREDGQTQPAKVAFLFPGQGSQRIGMLREMFLAFPELQRHLAADEDLARRIFPPTAWNDEERRRQSDALTDTRAAQPALGMVEMALFELLREVGVEPSMTAGHSYGELVALAAAQRITREDLLALSRQRATCILEATKGFSDTGAMAAVAASAPEVEPHIKAFENVVAANQNSPRQTVISGPTQGVEQALDALKAAGIAGRKINVACAFHSPLVSGATRTFGDVLSSVKLAKSHVPVFSNMTAAAYPAAASKSRDLLAGQIGAPVRFVEQLEAMHRAGATVFLECGPGSVLTGLANEVLAGNATALACESRGAPFLQSFLGVLGRLAVLGVPVKVDALHRNRDSQLIDLENPPMLAPSPNSWWVNGQRAWPMVGEMPANGFIPVTAPVVKRHAPVVTAAAGDRDAVVLEYLQGVRELIATQRQVMLNYLGDSASAYMEPPLVQPTTRSLPEPQVVETAPVELRPPADTSLVETPAVADIQSTLLAIVSERTGYPIEMLGLDVDMEADLSIDSIKRIEILGGLAERLMPPSSGGGLIDDIPEELTRTKTLRGIIEVFEGMIAQASPDRETLSILPADTPEGDPDAFEGHSRLVVGLREEPLESASPMSLNGKRVRLLNPPDALAAALEPLLTKAGALLASAEEESEYVVSFIDHQAELFDIFDSVRRALEGGTTRILLVSEGVVPGIAGMARSLSQEWTTASLKVVHMPSPLSQDAAESVIGELVTEDEIEVTYDQQTRLVPSFSPAAADRAATVSLSSESVVVVMGGARGVTAHVARAMAMKYGCRFEFVGRTVIEGVELPPDVESAGDAAGIRRALLESNGHHTLAEVEAEVRRLSAIIEVKRTLADVAAAGGTANYHALDATDAEALSRLLDDLKTHHGRIDGIIHAAGVIEDKLAVDKTQESFQRVVRTKLVPAEVVAKHADDVAFLAFFSSIAGVFGNRGQSDYAAASDYLDKLARDLNLRTNARVFSINWGPWRGAGMVSPELERMYESRGIPMLDLAEGAAAFIGELEQGAKQESQVVITAGRSERLLASLTRL